MGDVERDRVGDAWQRPDRVARRLARHRPRRERGSARDGDHRTRRGRAGDAMTSGVGLRSERGPVLIALMLSTALVAIDSTIIATAVPSIVKDIGGFAQFPWLFSIYLLAQAVTVPVYGKLADLFGRKPVILFGISLFLL